MQIAPNQCEKQFLESKRDYGSCHLAEARAYQIGVKKKNTAAKGN